MLTTHFVSPRRFSQDELRLTDLYARQAGIAIGRKRAEAALVTARESADRANKGKSHFSPSCKSRFASARADTRDAQWNLAQH
jgi:GAF domain-containing protein